MGDELDVRDKNKLSQTMMAAGELITKNYLCRLKELEVCEIPQELKELDIAEYTRIYRLRKLVTDKNESTIDKLVTILNAAYSSNATVVTLIKGNRSEVEYYLGVVSKDFQQESDDIVTQGEIFKGTLAGNFPGLSMDSLDHEEMADLFGSVFEEDNDNITAVSGLSSFRDEDAKGMEQYVQGLEHLVDALDGRSYSIIIIADPVGADELYQAKSGYESLYTQLSPFVNTSLSFNDTDSLTITDSHTQGYTHTVGESMSWTQNYTRTSGWSHSSTETDSTNAGKSLLTIAAAIGATAASGGTLAPIALTMAAGAAGDLIFGNKSNSETSGDNGSFSESGGRQEGKNSSDSNQESDTSSNAQGKTHGRTLQFSNENRTVKDLLKKIERNIERIEKCEVFGAFNCAAYVVSSDVETNAVVANGYSALMKGENSSLQSSHINQWTSSDAGARTIKEYIGKFTHPAFKCDGAENIAVSPASLESSYEVAVGIALPKKSINGLPVMESATFGRNIYRLADTGRDDDKLSLGNIFHMGSEEIENSVDLFMQSLSMHTFITGATGSGKSNTVYQILNELDKKGVHFLVIEPAKGEYKNVFGMSMAKVYGTNPAYSSILKINPFKFDKGIHVLEHIDRLVEIFNVCWPMYAAMPAVLKEAILRAYEVCGWDLKRSVNTVAESLFPTFKDLLEELVDVIDNSSYDNEVKSNYKGSLETRVKSLTNGLNGQIFAADEVDNEELFDSNVIVDLSRVGSPETKSLIMGILVMRLNEYRMAHSQGMNLPLRHITVLEEAHNILKRTSTEQDMESSNMMGKSVEMLSNAIAEMCTYGEGFIIADQSPSAVDASAIRNTNTKIIMRLPDEADRRAAGKSAALKDEQLDEIAKLPTGVAVVYQNDWVEPVLCKINRFSGNETPYVYERDEMQEDNADDVWFKTELLKLLLKGRVDGQIEVDTEKLRKKAAFADLSTKSKLEVYRLAEEYDATHKLKLWDDENFGALSVMAVELLECRNEIERLIKTVHDFEQLNVEFDRMQKKCLGEIPESIGLTLSQCFMKDYSVRAEENLEIYSAWREVTMKRGGLV